MKEESRYNIRTILLGIFLFILVVGVILFSLWLTRKPSPPELLILVPEDGLVRGEIYFYGPSDGDMLERYGASDEERKLVLLDGRPREGSPTNPNDYFYGGDLYCMAEYLNDRDFEKISTLPENSNIVFQFHFYYEDGSFVPVYVYPHAILANGMFYSLDCWDEDADKDRADFVLFLEQIFWTLSVGIWP